MTSYTNVITDIYSHLIDDVRYKLNYTSTASTILSTRDSSTEASLSLIIYSCVKPIFKIYLIIGTGFLLSKCNILDGSGIKVISSVVLTVLLPCLSFNKIVTNIADSLIKEVGIVMLSSVILFSLGAGCGIVANMFFKIPRKWRYGSICACTFSNISDLPIAYLQNMQSVFTDDEIDQGVAFVIIFLVAFMLSVFNLGGFKLVEYDFIQANKLIEQDIETGKGKTSNQNVAQFEMTNSQGSSPQITKNSERTDDEPQKDNDRNQSGGGDTSELESLDTQALNEDNSAQQGGDRDSAQEAASGSNSLSHIASIPSIKPKIYRNDGANDHNPLARKTRSRRLSTTSRQESIQSQYQALQKQKSLIQDFSTVDKEGNPIPDDPVLRFIKYNSKKLNNDSELQDLEKWASYHSEGVQKLHALNAPGEFNNNHHQNGDSDDDSDAVSSLHDGLSYVEPQETTASRIARMVTADSQITSKDVEEAGKGILPEKIRNIKGMKFIIFFIENCIRPCPLSVILGLIIAFIPWVKALFVSTTVSMPNAPDNLPPLSFIMDFTSYVGAASVPFGLLLLGATLGSLKIKQLPKGFWKAVVFLLLARQVFMPIIGILWCNRLVEAGWLSVDDGYSKVLLFVICIDFGLPSMTTMIYLTSAYTPIDTDDTTQMDCLSFFLLTQYPLLIINLPFAASYYLKVQLKA